MSVVKNKNKNKVQYEKTVDYQFTIALNYTPEYSYCSDRC